MSAACLIVVVLFADELGPYSGPPELAKAKIPEAY